MAPLLNNYQLLASVPVFGSNHDHKLYCVAGRPILNCRAFTRHKIHAVLAKFPNAAFVRGVYTLESLDGFMARNGITSHRPAASRNQADRTVVLHGMSSPFGERVCIRCTAAETDGMTIHRVDGMKMVAKYINLCKHNDIYLTVHKFDNAESIDVLIGNALDAEFDTSDGVLTGKQLLDVAKNNVNFASCSNKNIVNLWKMRGGEDEFGEKLIYRDDKDILLQVLAIESDYMIKYGYTTALSGDMRGLETFLNLDNSTCREVILECHHHISDGLLNKLLALDGKPPIGFAK